MKKCLKCNKTKSHSDFYKRKNSTDGLRSHCKECHKNYRELTKDRKSEVDKIRYLKNKEEIDSRAISYYHANKDKKRNYDQSRRQLVYEQRRERYQTDLNYKLKCNLRSRLHCALKRNKKSGGTMELLGCSIEDLKIHIESGFSEGMTWDHVLNGEIHIDHIIPCASFDLTNEEQQKECFNFRNLQPLWAKDNFKKSSKILE